MEQHHKHAFYEYMDMYYNHQYHIHALDEHMVSYLHLGDMGNRLHNKMMMQLQLKATILIFSWF
jgi:hypothetical protein